MIELIPAIMPASYQDLTDKVALIAGKVLSIQFDIMDGKFVPEKTWPYNQKIGVELLPGARRSSTPVFELHKIDSSDIFELDLMVENASERMNEWIQTGACRLIFHIEAEENLIANIEKHQAALRGIEIGLAIDIDTPNDELDPLLQYADFVQCMGIARIGYQGEPFDARVIEKIKEFKSHYPDVLVSVDGGVKTDNVKDLVDAGANRLVAGSAIFEGNIDENLEKFKDILK